MEHARFIVHNRLDEIKNLIESGKPAAWGMAAEYARDIANVCDQTASLMADPMSHGLRALAIEPLDGLTESADVIEAERVDMCHPEVFDISSISKGFGFTK